MFLDAPVRNPVLGRIRIGENCVDSDSHPVNRRGFLWEQLHFTLIDHTSIDWKLLRTLRTRFVRQLFKHSCSQCETRSRVECSHSNNK